MYSYTLKDRTNKSESMIPKLQTNLKMCQSMSRLEDGKNIGVTGRENLTREMGLVLENFLPEIQQ